MYVCLVRLRVTPCFSATIPINAAVHTFFNHFYNMAIYQTIVRSYLHSLQFTLLVYCSPPLILFKIFVAYLPRPTNFLRAGHRKFKLFLRWPHRRFHNLFYFWVCCTILAGISRSQLFCQGKWIYLTRFWWYRRTRYSFGIDAKVFAELEASFLSSMSLPKFGWPARD